jgi:ATP-dependent Clp protease protease subunit
MKQKQTITTTKTLLKDRSVFLFGDIDEGLAFSIIKNLRYLSKLSADPIKIFIHSNGGCVDAGAAIVDEMNLLKDSGIDIKTIVQGKAFSYASFISALGTQGSRYATPNSSFMLHEASTELPQDYLGKQEEYTKYVKKQMEVIMKMVATACGKGSAKKYPLFIKDVEKSIWLQSQEAIKYGLIDEIWTSKCL